VFGPGRYEQTNDNLPVMTALQSWKYGFNSPFKADVYFVNTRQFIDQKWGTSNPVMMRDAEFGMIRLRAFGVYSFRVSDPAVFLKEVFGTNPVFSADDVSGQVKRMIVSGLSDAIAQSKIPALDLAANYDELGNYAMQSLNPKLAQMGLSLCTFAIENISLPQEVEEAMDRRTSMGVVGDLNRYTQFQAAEAMREAANNEGANGGMAGMGIGMGAAAMMGQMFNQSMMNAQQPQMTQNAPAQQAGSFCSQCGNPLASGAKFCSNCGASQGAPKCSGCGSELAPGAKFCSNCGQKQ